MGSILQVVKGPEKLFQEKFKNNLEDGRLYFATDSKTIYLDCDFLDGEGSPIKDRIAFSGSSGIAYGSLVEADKTTETLDFHLEDFEGDTIQHLPEIDTLILNANGCFYRVIEKVEGEDPHVVAELLAVTGNGGGGTGPGGMIIAKAVDGNTKYFTIQMERMPIQFLCYSDLEGSNISAQVSLNNEVVIPSMPIKQSDKYPTTIDLNAFLPMMKVNVSNTVKVLLQDLDNGLKRTLTYTVMLYNLYVKVDSSTIPPQSRDYVFQCAPYGGLGLKERAVIVELYRSGTEAVVWSTEILTQKDKGDLVSVPIQMQPHGAYTIKTYIRGYEPFSNAEMRSVVEEKEILFIEAGIATPLISASVDVGTHTVQYEVGNVVFMVADSVHQQSTIHQIIEVQPENSDRREIVSEKTLRINNNEELVWNVPFERSGIYFLTIELQGGEYRKTLLPITVDSLAATIPQIDTKDPALELYLSAESRSNDEIDRDVWVSKYNNVPDNASFDAHLSGADGIKCIFENFNWHSNGWRTTEDGISSLHLDNGAKLIVPYSPFRSPEGAQYRGLTIELDFKMSKVKDRVANGITCVPPRGQRPSTFAIEEDDELIVAPHENVNPEKDAIVGLAITGQESAFNTQQIKTIGEIAASANSDHKGLVAPFKDGDRIHLTYVIQRNHDDVVQNFIYTYINGVISGLTRYQASDLMQDGEGARSAFIFDSSNMDIDIYNIRVYSQPLVSRTVLYNYIADFGDLRKSAKVWANNDVLDSEGHVSLDRVKEIGNIPYIIFEGGRACDKKGNLDPADETIRLPIGKKDYRFMKTTYVDPQDKDLPEYAEKLSFGGPEDPSRQDMVVYGQGTSSMEYPVKNLRIKFKNKSSKYSIKHGVPAVNLFCLKADYMDSSSSHNTGTGNTLSALYDSIGLATPAQKKYNVHDPKHPENENTVLTAIIGHPIVGFFRPEGSDTYQYVGRYNFNLDKSTQEVFGFNPNATLGEDGSLLDSFGLVTEEGGTALKPGFKATLDEEWDSGKTYYTKPVLSDENVFHCESKEAWAAEIKKHPLYEYHTGKNGDGCSCIECWEFKDNSQILCKFAKTWSEAEDPECAEWVAAFESRFPEYEEEQCADKRSYANMVNWLASTRQVPYHEVNDVNPDNKEEILGTHWEGIPTLAELETTATQNGEKEKFRLPEPVRYGDTLFEYDVKEYRKAKFINEFNDHFVKDFVIFYYILTELFVMIDSRAKNMMMCSFDADTEKGTGHYFPIFYDMDTMLGVNNFGVLQYNYDVEDVDEGVFNSSANWSSTMASSLWCNVRECFQEEITEMYFRLRSTKMKYENILGWFNNNQANAWSETYINEDEYRKYVRPFTNPEEYDKAPRLYAAQGTRSEHRKFWIANRLKYLDSKYFNANYIREDNHLLSLRISTPKIDTPEVKPDADFHVTSMAHHFMSIRFSQSTIGPVELLPGKVKVIPAPGTFNDTETYLYNIEDVADLGDLSLHYISLMEFSKSTPLSLRRLKIGNSHPQFKKGLLLNPSRRLESIPIGEALPFLEELDIENTLLKSLDMTYCPYLQHINAKGSDLTGLVLPEGGNLKKLELPNTLASLKIIGHIFYDTCGKNSTNLTVDDGFYTRLDNLFVVQCPLFDSYSFVKKWIQGRKENISGIKPYFRLPDVNWRLETSECEIGSDGTIVGIPVLDSLLNPSVFGGLSANNSHIDSSILASDHFGGTVTINNGADVGINELELYKKYRKRFPNLVFKYQENAHCLSAYSINLHDTLGQLRLEISDKFAESELEEKTQNFLTWIVNPEIMNVAKKSPTEQFNYKFEGWGTVEPLNFPEEAQEAMLKEVKIKVDDGVARYMNGYSLKLTDLEKEENLYPIYSKKVNIYEVSFYDGDRLIEVQKIPFGKSATAPKEIPTKVDLDPNDVSVTRVHTFLGFEPSYKDVRSNFPTYAKFSPETTDIRQTKPNLSNFAFSGGNALVETPVEAILIPALDSQGQAVTSVTFSEKTRKVLRRIYFESNNNITKMSSMSDDLRKSAHLEYVDLVAATKLEEIGPNFFSESPLLTISGLPDSVRIIGMSAFSGCPKLEITQLPLSLETLSAYSFADDIGIKELNIERCANLRYIGDHAFRSCINLTLTNKTLPRAVTEIGSSSFYECKALEIEDFLKYDQLTLIGANCFSSNSSLIVRNLPPHLVTIENGGFQTIRGLEIAQIPASVENLGLYCLAVPGAKIPMLEILNANWRPAYTSSEFLGEKGINENLFGRSTNIDVIVVPDSVDLGQAPWNTPDGWGSGAQIVRKSEVAQ